MASRILHHQDLAKRFLASTLLGAISVLGFAPFYWYPIPVLTLAGWFWLLRRASSNAEAAWIGYGFGLGLMGCGVSWIYVSLHDFGGMPAPMAWLATSLFCAFLALFYLAVGWLCRRTSWILLSAPVCLTLLEWVRSWIFTGFPWLNIGYSQIPWSPLAGFAPITGVYGLTLATALCASLLLLAMDKNRRIRALLVFTLVWTGASALKTIVWSQPTGSPFSVALVQGNIAQDIKWDPAILQQTLAHYLHLAGQSQAKLIVLPEAALPLLYRDIPKDYLQKLEALARERQGNVLFGVLELENGHYYNSMLSVGTDPVQRYRKFHLVPFGEYIPLKFVFGWIYRDWLNMPISDLSRGSPTPKPMRLAGQQIGINICYEDVFGEEIIGQLPAAGILVNASNMAWFGNSLSPDQHLQMSQARAMETQRMMLRATNTGATAVIDRNGHVLSQLPYFETGTLEAKVQAYSGRTPYTIWGNWPIIGACLLIMAGIIAGHFRDKSGKYKTPDQKA